MASASAWYQKEVNPLKKLFFLTAGLAAAAIMLASCGGDDDDDDAAEAATQEPGQPEEPVDEVDPEAAPPPLFLTQDGDQLDGQIGNYMWGGVVADAFAIITGTEPDEISAAPGTVEAPDDPFSGGTLSVFEADAVRSEPSGDLLRWTPEGDPLTTAEIDASGEIDLSSLEPGDYLVAFFGNWAEGYAEYGFYVTVQ